MKEYLLLMRLHKPIGIFLLLWPTLWALWLAKNGSPDFFVVFIFLLGVFLLRSAGCIINDIADRHFDLHVARTQDRPLTAGKISVRNALLLFFILIFCAFLLVLLLNPLSIVLSFIGLAFAVIYPYLKRITHLPQLGLSVAFSWGIPMAFSAETNTIPMQAWILFSAALWWPIIYDTLYAMVDKADDVKIGVKSTAILFGKYTWVVIAALQILFLGMLSFSGFLFALRWPFYFSLIIVALLFVYQQILMTRSQYFKAFLNNHWVGAIIFLGIYLS